MAARVRDRGHQVRILYRKRNEIQDWFKALRDRIAYAGSQDWLDQFEGRIDGFADITKCRFDEQEIIVGAGMAMSAELGLLNALSNPKIQYLHGSTPWAPELMQKTLSLPLPKIVVASYLKELAENTGRGEVLATIHNGIDGSEYFGCVPEAQRNGVGVIYSSHPSKDPATTLGVIEKLSRLHPEVPIRVFSADRRPAQLSSRGYWRYPTLDKAREIYSRSLVWIVASSSEGFPAPVLEAMACGCCVVATDCGGTRDTIVNGENGFLVPVGDVDGIAAKVDWLLSDVALRNRMRSKAEETVKQFAWDRCIDQLENVLSGLSRHSCGQSVPAIPQVALP
jgi:glycosyltransferase involved in cell wall biosynthesis